MAADGQRQGAREGARKARAGAAVPLAEAVDVFLAERDLAAGTRHKYAQTLAALVCDLGGATPVGDLDGRRLAAFLTARWEAAAPATWNRQRACLRSFLAFCERQGWAPAGLGAVLERRREPEDQTRAIPPAILERILTDRRASLRDRTLWRLLYESAARAEEILRLDVVDLDIANRRAVVVGKGGHREVVHFQTASARLLTRLVGSRRDGPVFLTQIRPAPARTPAVTDLDRASGHARLSYRRAAEVFSAHSGGRTLHQLRHSALTELASANVSLPLLMAKSRHRSLRSLQRYARPGVEAVAALTAGLDPARRR